MAPTVCASGWTSEQHDEAAIHARLTDRSIAAHTTTSTNRRRNHEDDVSPLDALRNDMEHFAAELRAPEIGRRPPARVLA